MPPETPQNSPKGRIRCAMPKFPEALAFGLALMVLPAWKWYILPMLHEAHEGHEDHATWTKMKNDETDATLVGGLEHLLFSISYRFIYGILIPTD